MEKIMQNRAENDQTTRPRYYQYIDGQFLPSRANEWHPSVYPATGEPWAEFPLGKLADAEAAVEAAARAFKSPSWSNMTQTERGILLRRLAELTAANTERLAELETKDNGKRYVETTAAINLVPGWLTYAAGLADKIEGTVIPVDKPDVFSHTRWEPLGVVAAIIPWNSPLWLLAWKLGPALAAGNTIVIKPSEFASVSVLEFMKLVDKAGFPPGVINVVTGVGPEVGQALVHHPDVALVSFTGSDAIGRQVAKSAGQLLKRVTLELGGKSAQLVFDDARLDAAVSGVLQGIFSANGQSCVAGSRLLLQAGIYDRFMERLIKTASGKRMGNPFDPEVEVAPLANKAQYEKTLSYIQVARDEGATCVLGGEPSPSLGGYFVEPTIFSNVTPSMRIAREEVFGPVLAVIRFETEEEAVEIANSTEYGLAAGVWTEDLRRALRLSAKLQSGTVWVNTYRGFSPAVPAGGYKTSGIGRENGAEAIKEFMQVKSVWMSTAR